MFPSEMAILMAIAVTGETGRNLLSRPMDVVGKYIGYLYDSLVRRGYLKRRGEAGYQLTDRGEETLFEFLYMNKARVKDAIKALQKLGIEINLEEDSLEKAAVRAKGDYRQSLLPSLID